MKNAQETFANIITSYELDGKNRSAAIALAIKQCPSAYKAFCEERARGGRTLLAKAPSGTSKGRDKFPSTGKFEDIIRDVMATQKLSRPKAAAFAAMNYPEEYNTHCRQRLALIQ